MSFPKFSQRIGKTPVKVQLQIESIDDDLRNGLWNVFILYFIDYFDLDVQRMGDNEKNFHRLLYHHLFKQPIDTIPSNFNNRVNTLREWFFESQWYELYDFIEFVARLDNLGVNIEEFRQLCNDILEREAAGYRFIDTQIAPITNEIELEEIEKAIETSGKMKFAGVHSHLKSALAKLSDRKKPDYRNSIKESISAIESISQVIAGNPKAELGEALKLIENRIGLHPALKKGFLAIYGYTSDADGIRHAMIEDSKCDFEDAKYMLVSCSAFVNYLIGKAAKAGIFGG